MTLQLKLRSFWSFCCVTLWMTTVVHAEVAIVDADIARQGNHAQDPKCFEESSSIKSSKEPEEEIKKLFSELSDEEVKARLVFAETLAAGKECHGAETSAAVSKGIAWVIENRVSHPRETFGKGRDAVFKKFQFRSSFGDCDVAMRKAFLCPSSFSKDWRRYWDAAHNAVKYVQKAEGNPMPKVYHYFFPMHFKESKNCKRWDGVAPNWASEDRRFSPEIVGLMPESNCVQFYELK